MQVLQNLLPNMILVHYLASRETGEVEGDIDQDVKPARSGARARIKLMERLHHSQIPHSRRVNAREDWFACWPSGMAEVLKLEERRHRPSRGQGHAGIGLFHGLSFSLANLAPITSNFVSAVVPTRDVHPCLSAAAVIDSSPL